LREKRGGWFVVTTEVTRGTHVTVAFGSTEAEAPAVVAHELDALARVRGPVAETAVFYPRVGISGVNSWLVGDLLVGAAPLPTVRNTIFMKGL